ncbi:MAG: DnaJ domain-containing protein [Scytonematopsis contorta HA4267-MV1]|jgi:molecular chaperone DnaJ|nr:DnaJ domain-containing protein [Scytonematopsis contorta HA4267-MV1]
MAETNHYDTLEVNSNASQQEIKQAYRRLVKQHHPDTNQDTGDNDQIIQINAAYEVLGDTQSRLNYDRRLQQRSQKYQTASGERSYRAANAAQQRHQARRKSGKDIDELVEEWLHSIYYPVNKVISNILNSLESQIEELSADPFDDELLEGFQNYLEGCQQNLKQAQGTFRSLPNPPSLARTAAHLYYTLNQIGDALNELEYFPLNYDESYLHAGLEMFRIAADLHCEAQESVEAIA